MTPTGEPQTVSTTAAAERDPAVAGLFHMSRTAGVGLQDYAAVNVLAVTGLLLGIASFLAIVVTDTRAILIIPAIAAVVCLAAFLQVRRSNGTQTGHLLAIGGLTLAVLFAGIHLAGFMRTAATEAKWTSELNTLAAKLPAAATTQGANEVYQLFDARFRETVSPETFNRVLQPRMQRLIAGKPVTDARVSDLVVYTTDENGIVLAQTLLRLSGELKLPDGKPATAEEGVEFRKPVGQPWQFHGITSWFGATKPTAGGAPGAAPGATPQRG